MESKGKPHITLTLEEKQYLDRPYTDIRCPYK